MTAAICGRQQMTASKATSSRAATAIAAAKRGTSSVTATLKKKPRAASASRRQGRPPMSLSLCCPIFSFLPPPTLPPLSLSLSLSFLPSPPPPFLRCGPREEVSRSFSFSPSRAAGLAVLGDEGDGVDAGENEESAVALFITDSETNGRADDEAVVGVTLLVLPSVCLCDRGLSCDGDDDER